MVIEGELISSTDRPRISFRILLQCDVNLFCWICLNNFVYLIGQISVTISSMSFALSNVSCRLRVTAGSK